MKLRCPHTQDQSGWHRLSTCRIPCFFCLCFFQSNVIAKIDMAVSQSMKGQNRSIRSPAGYIMFDGIRQAPPHLRTNRPSLSDTHLWLVLAREGSPVLDHSHVSHVFLLYPTPTPTQDMISVQRLCVHGLMNFLGTPTPDLCLQMSQVWVRLSAQMSQKWSEKWVRRVNCECVDEFLTDLFQKKV